MMNLLNLLEHLIFFQECVCRNSVLQIVQVSGARSTAFGDVHIPLLPQRLLNLSSLTLQAWLYIVIFIHYKPRIAVAILALQWMKMTWNGWKIEKNCHVFVK